jgi:hypothetical protein
MTCGTLEGILACLCRSLTSDSLIVEVQGHLNLHLGHEFHGMDDAPPLLGHTRRGTLLFKELESPLEVTH